MTAQAKAQSWQETPSDTERKQSTWTISLGLIVGLVGLYVLWPGFQSFINEAYTVLSSGEQQRVEGWVRSFGGWGFAGILVYRKESSLTCDAPGVSLRKKPMPAASLPHLQLNEQQRQDLERLTASGTLSARVFKRARGLLLLEKGKTLEDVADDLSVSRKTVANWRDRFREEALAMLFDKPRSGRPVEIDGTAQAKITALACTQPPEGHAHWDLRLLADKAVELGYCEHLSHTHASTILKKTNSSLT